MASPSGNRSGGEEGVLQKAAATAAKRLRRMISNRESARRSRIRKQKRLDDLAAQASRLGRENGRLLAAVKAAKRRCGPVEAENCVLRAQAMELGRRLRALDEIVLRFLDLSFGSGRADHNTLCDPWSLMHVMNQQPATAAAGNSVFYG